jgi:hypothetical protein
MRLIAFIFFHGNQMLQEAEVDIVLMSSAQGRKGGSKMRAVAAATAMAWHFTAVIGGEIK